VPVAEAHALHELVRHAPLAQSALARWLRLEKSTVSRLIAQLEGKGWALRERSTADGRMLLVQLTDDGRRVAAQIAAARQARFARLLAQIPAADRARVVGALAILVEAIDASR